MSLVCIPRMFCKPGKAAQVAGLVPVQDCIDNQPKTLAYYFFSLHKSPDTILGFELYADKSGLKEHAKADSFKTFSEAAGPLFEKPFALAQAEPKCGFLSKGAESASQIISDRSAIAVLATVTCVSEEARSKVLQIAASFIGEVEKEQGTLSYHWSADLLDPTKIYVFERYTDAAAAQHHSANTTAFKESVKGLVGAMVLETGVPVGGFLKKTPSLMESNVDRDDSHYSPAPALPSNPSPPSSVADSLSSSWAAVISPLPSSTNGGTGTATSPDPSAGGAVHRKTHSEGSGDKSHSSTTPRKNPSVTNDASFTSSRNGVPQSIAHRGYKALFPENTMIALLGALKSGADGIETDVHLSRDGVVVISHDASTQRCYGVPGDVWHQDFHGPRGMSTYKTIDAPYTSMPTLREVLQLIADTEWREKWVLIDIKVDNQVQIIEAIADTLHSINPSLQFWSSRVVLGIWHHAFLPYCAQYLPSLPITHIGVHVSYANSHFLHDPAISSFNLHLNALYTARQRAFVERAREMGKQVYIWTVNDVDAMRYVASLHVDAILSDDPSKTHAVRNEPVGSFDEARYWTYKRIVRGGFMNAMLYCVMWYRFFWKFRELRSQAYRRYEEGSSESRRGEVQGKRD